MIDVKESADGVTFAVRVLPRSSRNEIVGEAEGVLKIKLTAPPVEGAANKALIEFLSGKLKVAKSRISIVTGQSGRSKIVAVEGLNKTDFLNSIGLSQ
jgi:uncharacterized protein (TIGR00251 family)